MASVPPVEAPIAIKGSIACPPRCRGGFFGMMASAVCFSGDFRKISPAFFNFAWAAAFTASTIEMEISSIPSRTVV